MRCCYGFNSGGVGSRRPRGTDSVITDLPGVLGGTELLPAGPEPKGARPGTQRPGLHVAAARPEAHPSPLRRPNLQASEEDLPPSLQDCWTSCILTKTKSPVPTSTENNRSRHFPDARGQAPLRTRSYTADDAFRGGPARARPSQPVTAPSLPWPHPFSHFCPSPASPAPRASDSGRMRTERLKGSRETRQWQRERRRLRELRGL